MRISYWSSDVCSSDLDTLDLAAEIGVTRGIDDVDPRQFRAFTPFDAGAFRTDRDSAFFFEIVRIHRAFFDTLVVAKGPRLAEQLVDAGGFSMIDVGDNGTIAQRKAETGLDGRRRHPERRETTRPEQKR